MSLQKTKISFAVNIVVTCGPGGWLVTVAIIYNVGMLITLGYQWYSAIRYLAGYTCNIRRKLQRPIAMAEKIILPTGNVALQWRHNEFHGVWIHRRLYCMFNLYQIKYQGPRHWPFVRGIHRWPVDSQRKGPVTGKQFLFDDVNIVRRLLTSLFDMTVTWKRNVVANLGFVDIVKICWQWLKAMFGLWDKQLCFFFISHTILMLRNGG